LAGGANYAPPGRKFATPFKFGEFIKEFFTQEVNGGKFRANLSSSDKTIFWS